ncbi:hypothetical protein ACH5RR_018557 [Cinchona calisaya]|uniref:Uncharacterized protein n=1 Tax=Cinchona calisaya TaxID=153742 RepID=A0ABD2ZMA1_9GENT
MSKEAWKKIGGVFLRVQEVLIPQEKSKEGRDMKVLVEVELSQPPLRESIFSHPIRKQSYRRGENKRKDGIRKGKGDVEREGENSLLRLVREEEVLNIEVITGNLTIAPPGKVGNLSDDIKGQESELGIKNKIKEEGTLKISNIQNVWKIERTKHDNDYKNQDPVDMIIDQQLLICNLRDRSKGQRNQLVSLEDKEYH